MALVEIKHGSEAKSEPLNNNFNFLLEEIQTLAITVQNNKEILESSLSSSNSNIISTKETLEQLVDKTKQSLLDNINSLLSSNGLFFTKTISGDSFCLEYFSDTEKTNRVFMLLFGKAKGFSTVTFLKKFTTLYGLFAQVITSETCVSAAIQNQTTTSFYITDGTHGGKHEDRGGLSNYWFAIGT